MLNDLTTDYTPSGSMSPGDRERVAEILDDYLQHLEAGDAVSPDELCEKHPALADRLRGYLSGLQLVGAVMPGASERLAPAVDLDVCGNRLGDYELIREIGRGGMGVVYEARQVSLNRRVALKILPFGSVLDGRQLTRFKNEAQAAAQVHHPNIAPVFAVGQDKGVHFYAMQFIEGHSLARMIADFDSQADSGTATVAVATKCSDARSGNVEPSSASSRDSADEDACQAAPLSPSDTIEHVKMVARLGVQAAEALNAAHEFGVVHRDVKPSNLLLDESGKLWVTDFGVARCQREDSLTATGDLLGTMRYMSPEQALGVPALIDHRTDVYSLGVTLYQLATGHHPLVGVSQADLLLELRQPHVPPLRLWNASIPRDFETVILKAMTVARDERYATANDLAADLSRFLRNEPVHARRPSLGSRATKWVKRHAPVVAASACVLFLAAVGLLVSVLMISHEKRLAEKRSVQATQSALKARETVDELMAAASELAGAPQMMEFRMGLLQRAREYYEEFLRQSSGNTELAAELARAHNSIGFINSQLGRSDDAMESYRHALEVLQSAAATRSDDAEVVRQLARAHNNVGQLLHDAGDLRLAHQHLSKAVALDRELCQRFPDDLTYRAELANTLGNLGLVALADGRLEPARRALTESKDAFEQLLKLAPDDESYLKGAAAACNNLSALPGAPALDYRLAARDRQQRLCDRHPDKLNFKSDLAVTLNNVAVLRRRRGELPQGETSCQQAISIGNELVKAAPDVLQYRRDLAISHNNLGMVQRDAHQLDEASSSFQTAAGLLVDLQAQCTDDTPTLSRLGGVYNNLGMVYMDMQRFDDARQMFEEAVARQSAALASAGEVPFYRESLSKHYFNLANCLRSLERPREALDVSRRRRELWPSEPDRLLSVAEEMAATVALIDHLPDSRSAESQQLRETCVAEAKQTLRDAIANGLTEPPSPTSPPWSSLASPDGAGDWLDTVSASRPSHDNPARSDANELAAGGTAGGGGRR